jgi:hypothetical protein
MSYFPSMVRYLLTHYLDVPAAEGEGGRSPNRGNPSEASWAGRADLDRGISSLCPHYEKDLWPEICQLSPELMRARLECLSKDQRYVVQNCIFGECVGENGLHTPCQYPKNEYHRYHCREAWAVNKIVKFLNEETRMERESSLLDGALSVPEMRKAWQKKRNLKQFRGK